jgi:hypothetical protein
MKAPLPNGHGSETHAQTRDRTHAQTEPRPPGSGALDDETAAYILETRRSFEDLQQVAAQLAGLLVLAAAGSKNAGPHHPMLDAAERLYQEAIEGIRSARVPARAGRHHRCLLQAAGALRNALSAAHGSLEIDPVLIPLRAAYDQLQRASNELPGFEIVAFDQGCCGSRL